MLWSHSCVCAVLQGLRSDGERIDRWQDDCRLSERVEADSRDAAKWDAWLRWWYSKPL